MSARYRMSDETLDGIVFGMRLASNPKIRAANEAFQLKLRLFRAATKDLTKDNMIARLKEDNPAYILDLLNGADEALVRDRYVWTFVHRFQPSDPAP